MSWNNVQLREGYAFDVIITVFPYAPSRPVSPTQSTQFLLQQLLHLRFLESGLLEHATHTPDLGHFVKGLKAR